MDIMADDLKTSHRWTGREADYETYDLIFDQAINLISNDEKTVGTLLMRIINEWEKDERSVPLPILAAALDLAQEHAAIRELTDGLRVTFQEPPADGMPSGGMNG